MKREGRANPSHFIGLLIFIIIHSLQCFIEEKQLYRKNKKGGQEFYNNSETNLFEEIHFFFNYIILRRYIFETRNLLRTFMNLLIKVQTLDIGSTEKEGKKVFVKKRSKMFQLQIYFVQRRHLTCTKSTLTYQIQRRALGSLQQAQEQVTSHLKIISNKPQWEFYN